VNFSAHGLIGHPAKLMRSSATILKIGTAHAWPVGLPEAGRMYRDTLRGAKMHNEAPNGSKSFRV